MMKEIKQGEIWIVNLDPTVGSEIRKTRPCLIVSPDELNQGLRTVLIAPISSQKRGWDFRPLVEAKKVKGEIILDQIRSVDKKRLHKKVATMKKDDLSHVLDILQRMFASA